MCDVCLKSPCDPRCPNAQDPPAVHVCSGCGRDILDGDKFYRVMGEPFCEECIEDSEEIAEHETY